MGTGPGGGLIVERLGDETLVYDATSNKAHRLDGAAAAAFAAASDDLSRREVIARFALAGAAASASGLLVKSIVAPSPAQAQSLCGDGPCLPSEVCCVDTLECCGSPTHCCPTGSATPCCLDGNCCPAGSFFNCGVADGIACLDAGICCSGCCIEGFCAQTLQCGET
jgi:hypothetical protein